MEFTSKTSLPGGISSRAWSLVIAALAAIIAAVLVVSAINGAKKEGGAAGGAKASIVVADRLIAKGTSGVAIASGESYKVSELRSGAVVDGAVTDVSQIRDKVATRDIYPGQQLAASDFRAADGALATKLARNERAIAIPVDAAHGLIGEVKAGDRVDVLAGFNLQRETGRTRPVMKAIATNVSVLKSPKGAAAGSSQNGVVSLKVSSTDAAQLAFAADNGKLWVVLRAPGSTRRASSEVVSAESLLLGVKAIGGGQ